MRKQSLIMAILEEKTNNLLKAGYIEQMLFLRDCFALYPKLQGGMLETQIVDKIIEITQKNWNEYLESCLNTFREKSVRKSTLKKCKIYIEDVAKKRKFSSVPFEIENRLQTKLSETSRLKLNTLYENIEIDTVNKLNEYLPPTFFSNENLKSWGIAIIQSLLGSLIWYVIVLVFGVLICIKL